MPRKNLLAISMLSVLLATPACSAGAEAQDVSSRSSGAASTRAQANSGSTYTDISSGVGVSQRAAAEKAKIAAKAREAAAKKAKADVAGEGAPAEKAKAAAAKKQAAAEQAKAAAAEQKAAAKKAAGEAAAKKPGAGKAPGTAPKPPLVTPRVPELPVTPTVPKLGEVTPAVPDLRKITPTVPSSVLAPFEAAPSAERIVQTAYTTAFTR